MIVVYVYSITTEGVKLKSTVEGLHVKLFIHYWNNYNLLLGMTKWTNFDEWNLTHLNAVGVAQSSSVGIKRLTARFNIPLTRFGKQ